MPETYGALLDGIWHPACPRQCRSRRVVCRRCRGAVRRWRLASRTRSRILSRSFSATADRIVNTSLEMPLPVTSPPRSIRDKWGKSAVGNSKKPVERGLVPKSTAPSRVWLRRDRAEPRRLRGVARSEHSTDQGAAGSAGDGARQSWIFAQQFLAGADARRISRHGRLFAIRNRSREP